MAFHSKIVTKTESLENSVNGISLKNCDQDWKFMWLEKKYALLTFGIMFHFKAHKWNVKLLMKAY